MGLTFFNIVTTMYSNTYVQASPHSPASQKKQPLPHPLPVGEGSEYPRLLLEDGARRPPSYLKYALFVLSAFTRPTEVMPCFIKQKR